MAVAVLGPGAVGGVLAARLAASGQRVTCVARPDAADALRSEGLTIVHDGGEQTVRPDVVEDLTEPVELLLVAVKAMHLDDALGRASSS